MDEVKRNSILIVDDENPNIIVLTAILSPEYTVYAANKGATAIKVAEKYIPDLILLDIVMPDMDGYAVISELKKSDITKNIPVIFVTALSEEDQEEKGLSMGASDYVTKPFNSTIVKLRVKNQIKIINQMQFIIEKELKEKNNRLKNEFLSRMNHEILTPLNIITGMTQMLKISDNPGKMDIYIDKIDGASKELLRLVNNLLDFSGMNEGEVELTVTNFSFINLIEELKNKIEVDIKAKNHIFDYQIAEDVPLHLVGDKYRLSKVIFNLLSNAVKFTPSQGSINLNVSLVETVKDTVKLQIEVSDNGEGIPHEKQNEIFGIFEQKDGSHTRRHGGIGMGLSICKYIVEMMDGKIWVESEPKKGSKFIFTCVFQKKGDVNE